MDSSPQPNHARRPKRQQTPDYKRLVGAGGAAFVVTVVGAVLIAGVLGAFVLPSSPSSSSVSYQLGLSSCRDYMPAFLDKLLHRSSTDRATKASSATNTNTAPPQQQVQSSTDPAILSSSNNNNNTNKTTPNMSSSALFDALASRHSVYTLEGKASISDAKIEEIVTRTLEVTPSAFNSQTTRLVLLLGEAHHKFWDNAKDIVKSIMPEEAFKGLEPRFGLFRGGYGSVLFFEDGVAIQKLQSQYASYAGMFPQWSEHTNAMHQIVLWTALEAEGLGGSLQHFNFAPPIEVKTREVFGLPAEWSLKAQLVFGDIKGEKPGAKDKLPTSTTLKVVKS